MYINYPDSECVLFPSKEQRDWSNFKIDLPIDSSVMVSNSSRDWSLRYYAGNNEVYINGFSSKYTDDTCSWKYIIRFDKFNPSNIEESLKYNIVNN